MVSILNFTLSWRRWGGGKGVAPGRLHKDTYLIRSGQGAARGFGREGLVGTGPRRPGAGLSRVEFLLPACGGPVHPTLEPKAPGAGGRGPGLMAGSTA